MSVIAPGNVAYERSRGATGRPWASLSADGGSIAYISNVGKIANGV
jgi:hypothetical protein